ncbi:MAG: class I SAM-dependent methyltransferase [Thermodesulfobacteriota bacterium]|nr:class I SAM-dependent methyltransferase [Thermodesulfobacteriota bacterium]
MINNADTEKIEYFYNWSRDYWYELGADSDKGLSSLLNFGCWDSGTVNLYQAQQQLFDVCTQKLCPIQSNACGLEVGCGIGGNSIRLCQQQPVNMTAMDISTSQLNIAINKAQALGCANRIKFVSGDSMAMPFDDEMFDFSICIESTFHYPRLDRYVAEQHRVLKPGAKAIIADITCEDPTQVKFRQGNHFYSVQRMQKLLLESGFKIIDIHRIGSSVFEAFYRYMCHFNQQRKTKVTRYWSLVLLNYVSLYRQGVMGYDIFEIVKSDGNGVI